MNAINDTTNTAIDARRTADERARQIASSFVFIPDHSFEDQLAAHAGFAVVNISELHRYAGGKRWRTSVADGQVKGPPAVSLWLRANGLEPFSQRGNVASSGSNGTVMVEQTMRRLRSIDFIVVLDRSTPTGAALLSGAVQPDTGWNPTISDTSAHEDIVRVANCRDVVAVLEAFCTCGGGSWF